MKITRDAHHVDGSRTVTLILDKNESILPISDNMHYELGEPLNDIVPGYILKDSVPVTWCCIEQKWVK